MLLSELLNFNKIDIIFKVHNDMYTLTTLPQEFKDSIVKNITVIPTGLLIELDTYLIERKY